jgi:hypothetical protein
MLKLLLLIYMGCAPLAYASNEYLREKLNEALTLFPVNMAFDFEMVSLDSDALMGGDLCSTSRDVRFAQTILKRGHQKIQVSKRLVELAQSNKQEFPCLHGSYERLLLATLVHELVHVRDNVEKISLDPDFQRIVGMKRITRSSRKKVSSHNALVSPDAYEFVNLEEALAVNLEYYLLDPQFECRRPALAGFLKRRFGIHGKGLCQKNYQVIIQSSFIEDNYLKPQSIDPSRIYQIHYLFAGRGRALMSRWGHSMFRLVMCAPHRKVVGPNCMNDVSHHIVLSYRAFINGSSINYKKGLLGEYPSQLFIMRWHEIQQEYTKFELRDVYSVPLKLTSEQKQAFIDLTMERYWSYQGRYYFLTNNCGTEAQKHLALALTEEQSELVHSITPLRIFKDITDANNDLTELVIEGMDREEMVQQGILIESMEKELQKDLSELRSYGIFRDKKLSKFIKKRTAEERLQAYEDFFSTQILEPEAKKILIMRLTHLERYLYTRFMMELPIKAVAMMGKDEELQTTVEELTHGILTLALQPWDIVRARYGVPSALEFSQQFDSFKEQRKMRVQNSLNIQMRLLEEIMKKEHFESEALELSNYQKLKTFTNKLILSEVVQ